MPVSLFSKALVSLRWVLVALLLGCSGSNVWCEDACPDVETSDGESLDYFFTDRDSSLSINAGATVPKGTLLDINILATAYGHCRRYSYDPRKKKCIQTGSYERAVGGVHVSVNIQADGPLNGWYRVGNFFGRNPANGKTAWYHVLNSRDENTSTGPIGSSFYGPGVYTFRFMSSILQTPCDLPPYDVVKDATIHVFDPRESMDTCNTMVGKSVSVASGKSLQPKRIFPCRG